MGARLEEEEEVEFLVIVTLCEEELVDEDVELGEVELDEIDVDVEEDEDVEAKVVVIVTGGPNSEVLACIKELLSDATEPPLKDIPKA